MEIGSVLPRGICGPVGDVRQPLTCMGHPLPWAPLTATCTLACPTRGDLNLQSLETQGGYGQNSGALNLGGKTLQLHFH